MDNNIVRQFENHQIRSAWNADEEQWYFSVVDVVGALTESTNPTDYLKKMRKRDEELATFLGTNCPQIAMKTPTGKLRKTLAGTPKHVLRVIQSRMKHRYLVRVFHACLYQMMAARCSTVYN